MYKLILFLLLFLKISSSDHSVDVLGVINGTRYILLSKNTLSSEDYDVSTSGSDEFLIGSVELLFFSNEQDSGVIKMKNGEYHDSKFRALKGSGLKLEENQIRITVKTDTNPTTGAKEDPTILLTEAAAVKILDPSTDIAGLTYEKKVTLEFYTRDDVDNSLADGRFLSTFSFFWEDD